MNTKETKINLAVELTIPKSPSLGYKFLSDIKRYEEIGVFEPLKILEKELGEIEELEKIKGAYCKISKFSVTFRKGSDKTRISIETKISFVLEAIESLGKAIERVLTGIRGIIEARRKIKIVSKGSTLELPEWYTAEDICRILREQAKLQAR